VLYLLAGKLMVVEGTSRTSRELYSPPANSDLKGMCASPDGRAIYIVRATQQGGIWLGSYP